MKVILSIVFCLIGLLVTKMGLKNLWDGYYPNKFHVESKSIYVVFCLVYIVFGAVVLALNIWWWK
mgnify:CR=1 FL=1